MSGSAQNSVYTTGLRYHFNPSGLNDTLQSLDISIICILLNFLTDCAPPVENPRAATAILTTSASFFLTTPDCSNAFYARSGTFSSPGYSAPNGSLSNNTETCEWRITAAEDEKIILNVTNIDIIKTPDCGQGFVEIRDGLWDDSPLLERNCGHGRLDPVLATGNKMYVLYHYNNPRGHRGFIANYEALCGGDLFVQNATNFSTPNYPGKYPLKKKCVWRIVVPQYQSAALTFQSFDLEYQSGCLYDYVEIRDGLTEDSDLIRVFCGSKLPLPLEIISNTSYLYVKFVSDKSVQKGGFLATVQGDYDECLMEQHDCAQICVNTIGSYECACRPGYQLHSNGNDCEAACGGTLNATSGIIHSPSYPDIYPANTNCTWNIVWLENHLIKISFLHFDLEIEMDEETGSPNDYLKIYHKTNENDDFQLHGSYSGGLIPGPISFYTKAVKLVFSSDNTIQKTGFLLNYIANIDLCSINNGNCHHECNSSLEKVICQCPSSYSSLENKRDCAQNNCHFEIASVSGQIKSPNYPNYYYNNQNCTWSFKTTPGHRLQLMFKSFQTENCCDCVFFYDGLFVSDRSLGKFCGSVLPPLVTSSTNELYLNFKTDGGNTGKGFLADYYTICGGQLQATEEEKYIYSHVDYGYTNYSNHVDCEWIISTERGNAVVLSFLNFHVRDCKDYVEILDGDRATSLVVSLGKFCGSKLPPTITSVTNVVTVRFRSNRRVTDQGFSLIYQTKELSDDTSSEESVIIYN